MEQADDQESQRTDEQPLQVVGDDEVHLFMNLTAKIEKGKRSDK